MKFRITSPDLLPPFESDDRTAFRKRLANWLGPIEGLRLVLVADEDGNIVGSSGDSSDLSSPDDLELLLAARSVAGAAITSAKTAVAEQLNQSSLCPILVVFGGTDPGDFPGRSSADRSKHSLHLLKSTDSRFAPATILNAAAALARATGRTGFLIESGLTLARSFASEGLIRQVVLSTKGSPSGGASAPSWLSDALNISPARFQSAGAGSLGESHSVTKWNILP